MDTLPTKICTYCHKSNEHIWSGKKLKDGSKIYTNKKNQRWAGKRCPICEHERVRNSLKVDAFKKARAPPINILAGLVFQKPD